MGCRASLAIMHRILLVEDDTDCRRIVRTYLEHLGYEVLAARDGEEGIYSAQEHLPDLILMDISIPKIDGWEATRILKADTRTSGIPIIALTAHALQAAQDKALEAGCDGYLAKPIDPRDVGEEVRRRLAPPSTPLSD